jgi:biotin carboxyl carrier protein
VARAGRLARKTGLSWGPILTYLAVVLVATGGLVAWDVAYRRREEEARRPPPPEVLVRNLVENIIGRGSVKALTVDEAAGTVDVTFESATYPPAARALVSGEVVARNLDQLLVGLRVARGDPLVYVRTSDGKVVLGAQAEYAGRVVAVLVKAGDRVQEGRAMVLIEPDDKTEARKNLETEGLLASQAVLSQLPAIRTVTSRIIYKDITLATVVGTRGERGVTTTYHPSLH